MQISLEQKKELIKKHAVGSKLNYEHATNYLAPNFMQTSLMLTRYQFATSDRSTSDRIVSELKEVTVKKRIKEREARYKTMKSAREISSKTTLKVEESARNLTRAKELIKRLKLHRARSEQKPEDGSSFNIITNKDVNYFNVTNYNQLRAFKKVNDTIKPEMKDAKKSLPVVSKSAKYIYSGMQEHQFLNYSDTILPQTRTL